MLSLTPAEAAAKRDQLVSNGFCVVPGVIHGEFLQELQQWTDHLLDTRPVPEKVKYQGSDFHFMTQRRFNAAGQSAQNADLVDPIIDRLVDWPEQNQACAMLGLEDRSSDETAIILSKPAGGPALYWHQDWMQWDSPASATPWPTRIFLSYYMVDTTRENGCLRAIPGTHRKRIPLHDLLPNAHEGHIQAQDESHPAFMDHPDAVDLPVKAGDLVINDARVLHSAWPNRSDRRRTLVLQWQSVFRFPNPPSWWQGEVPDEINNADPQASYPCNRTPGKYLRA
jgi:hypothetical protein